MDILEALTKTTRFSKVAKLTGIKKDKLKRDLTSLVKEDKVYYNKRFDEYNILLTGKLSLKNELFGFIIPDDETKEDVYVNSRNLGGALDGDKVLYYTYRDFYKNEMKEYAEIIKVLERGRQELVGTLKVKKTKTGMVYYIESSNPDDDFVATLSPNDYDRVVPGMIVRVALSYKGSKKVLANLIEVVGNIDDPGIEISTIAATYGFAKDFPIEVKEEVKTIAQSLDEKDYIGRIDFRNLNIITIDGDDSKDFDDAISVEKLENGNYRLGVYIADVSNYVRFGHPLDDEAFKRGTSVYLADRVIPMLPHELSNGICSLNEGVDRLVMAITMEFDNKGDCKNYKIEEGVINSKHRMTYNKVNLILKGNETLINEYKDIYQMLLDMNSLHEIIRAKRESKGSLEFEVDEYKFTLNEDGSPKSIELRVRDEAEKIIEDFMVSANEMIAYHLSISELPCLFRVHEKPDQDKLRNVFNMITNMGVSLKVGQNDIHPRQIQTALEKISDSPRAAILNQLLLRSMMKAKYQPENLGHYGLALKYYCHFTSPIRRYPDLIVHRILKELIIHPNHFTEHLRYYQNNLEEIGLKTSSSERRAIECERTVNDMLQAWYMETNIHKVYHGMITSITGFGIFVTIDSGVEGLIHIRNIDGYATFDEKKVEMNVGDKTYHLGDMVDVYVIASDRRTTKIDFMLLDDAKDAGMLDENSSY